MIDMDSRLTCIYLFSIFICVSALAEAERFPDELGQYLSGILYGDQWTLGRYCDDTRDSKERLASDQGIEALYNGSYLEHINTTSDWSAALDRLDRANLVGAQSRQELSIVCSINSWGYADKLTEGLSNEPHENASDCLAQLNQFYTFVRKLALNSRQPAGQNNDCNKSNGGLLCPSSRESSAAHSSETTNFSLNYWLQFNAFGRMTSGRPYNSNLLLGDYDACTRSLDSTRYCLGAYDKPSRGKTNNDPSRAGAQSVVWPYRVGLCLPKSCSSRILTKSAKHMKMIDSIVKSNLLQIIDSKAQGSDAGHQENHPDDRYQLTDLYCPPIGDSVYIKNGHDLVSQLLKVYLPLAWLAMLLIGTLYPFIETINGCSSLGKTRIYRDCIGPFDLCQNWRGFLNLAHADPRLIGLNGTKVIAMNWLILTHIAITLYPYLNDIGKLRSASSLHGAFILQGQHGVPIFFIISGLLVGIKHLRRDSLDFKSMLLSRYLRLAPMYLIVYAYVKKFGHLIGDGPLWDYGVSKQSEARQCMNESWLVPVLMLANFTPPFAHCVITGWHIANDFQIYFILPLLLRAYKYSRLYGSLLVGTMFLLTHMTHAWYWGTADNYNFNQIALEPFLFGPRVVLDRLALDYVNPLGRVGTYFLGVLVADLLISSWRHESGVHSRQGCAGAVAANRKSKKQVTFKNRLNGWTSGISLLNSVAADSKTDNKNNTLTLIESSGKFSHNHQVDTQLSSSSSSQEGGYRPDNSGQSNLDTKSSALSATRPSLAACTSSAGTGSMFANSKNHLKNEESLSYRRGGSSTSRRSTSRAGSDGRTILLSSFKANTMVLVGMFLAYGAVFSVLLPSQLKLTFGPKLSKAISYPLCRFGLEIGWALLLYCLLKDGQQSSRTSARATAGHRRPSVRQQTRLKRASRKTKRRPESGATTGSEDLVMDLDMDDDKDGHENGQDINSSSVSANCPSRPKAAFATAPTTTIIGARSSPPPPPSSSSSSSSPSSSSSSPPIDEGGSGLGFGGFLLKKSFWNVLVKLNYTLMLTHYTLVRYIVQSHRQLIAFTWTNYFQLTAFLLLAAYALSLLVHLTIEMPVMSLTKLLLSKVIAQRRPAVV